MLFYLVSFLAAYIPFQLALSPLPGVDLASLRVFILLIFLLWLAKGLKDRKINFRNDLQTACLCGFVFLEAFSIFFARNFFWGERKALFILSVVPLYFVAADVLDGRAKIKKILAYLVSSAAAAALLGIGQFLLQFLVGLERLYHFWANYVAVPFLGRSFSQAVLAYPSWLVNVSGHTYFRAISVFPDPHMFSLFLGLILPLSLGLFFEEKKKKWLIFSLIILLADLLTFSRGGYVALLGGVIFLLIVFWQRFRKSYRIGLVVGTAVIFLSLLIPGPISARFFSSFDLTEGSNEGRLAMWKMAGENILTHPMIGLGLGNFPLAVNPLADYREPIYAHDTYLDIAVEAGVPAALAWIGVVFFSARAFFEKSKRDSFYLAPVFSLAIFSTHSLVETGLYSPVVLSVFLLIISFSGLKKYEKSS